MLIISRAFRPTEPPWEIVNVTSVHAGGNPIVPGGITIWTPPFPCLVRAFTVNADNTNPVVGAGGATTVSIGGTNYTSALYSSSIATLNNRLQGWGGSGPGVTAATGIGTQEAGVVFAPAGSVPGSGVQRVMLAVCDAGTVTGTLRFRFEMRRFAGAWV